MSKKKLGPKEQQLKFLEEMKWPPLLEIEGQKIQLDEMDVSWTFCTVLNMRWADAKVIDDITERKFLWTKAQMIAQAMEEQQQKVENKSKQLEQSIDNKIQQMNQETFEEGVEKVTQQLNL